MLQFHNRYRRPGVTGVTRVAGAGRRSPVRWANFVVGDGEARIRKTASRELRRRVRASRLRVDIVRATRT